MPILLESDYARPLPEYIRVKQHFDDTHLEDAEVPAALRASLSREEIRSVVKPGMRVAVGVGSRGIRNLLPVVQETVRFLKEMGAHPFIVSAMGSHGSGTEEGQRETLYSYGITEENLGVPVVTTVDTVLAGHCKNGRPVWFDRAASEADLIVPVNRVKLHTDFAGPLQSGLCKMLVIGLGNHKGCTAVHEENIDDFAEVIEETASLIMEKMPVGFGVALMENAYDQTFLVEAVPGKNLIAREKELAKIAEGKMPFIRLPEADVIVCQYIGKDISGAGFDPNILGRSTLLKTFRLHIPNYQRLVLLDVTPASHGNAIGLGLFDFVTQKVVDQLNLEAIYANAIPVMALRDACIPLTMPDEDSAVRAALKCCRGIDRENPKIIRIHSTLHLEHIEVTPALLPDVERTPGLTIE